MIELTEQQQQQLRDAGWPPCIVNPRTQERFVLLHAEMFERIRTFLEEQDEISTIEEMYPLMNEVLDAEETSDEAKP